MSKKLRYIRNGSGYVIGTSFSVAPGGRSISFATGHIFHFNESQSIIIDFLVESLVEHGVTHVPSSSILERLQQGRDSKTPEGSDADDLRSKLKDYFKNHPAWGILIKNTGPGRGSKVYLDFDLSPTSDPSLEM